MARHQTTADGPTNRHRENVMVDIETLGTDPGSAIIAIGLCEFDAAGLGSQRHISVSTESCEQYGMSQDEDTVEWWESQPEQARQQLDGGAELPEALDKVSKFCDRDQKIWANSPAFDVVMLEDAYRRCFKQPPWEFWNTRDMRTVRDLLPWPDELERIETIPAGEHHALHDAIAQARKTRIALNRFQEVAGHE